MIQILAGGYNVSSTFHGKLNFDILVVDNASGLLISAKAERLGGVI